ncbi:MAG: hypothetical protein KUG77_00370 [Nannocystaceae bacterium]|nr:hypothetical protein [Nannocystaceae bacterium]
MTRRPIRTFSQALAVIGLTAAVTLACGDDRGATDDDSTGDIANGTTGARTTGGETTGAASTGPGTSGDTTQTGDSTGGAEPGPAAGIQFAMIDVNQGVAIELARDGTAVPPTSVLIDNRPLIMRATWVVEDSWEPREIEARLAWHLPDGSERTYSSVLSIAGSRAEDDPLAATFSWVVEPQFVVADTSFSVTLWETALGSDSSIEIEDVQRFPESGTQALPVDAVPRALNLVLVPFEYDVPGCHTVLEPSDEAVERLAEYLYMLLPVSRIDIQVLDSTRIDEPISTHEQILNNVVSRRGAAAPASGTFFLGVIDLCEPIDAGGSAFRLMTPPTAAEDPLRALWVRWRPDDPDRTHYVLGHELGHSLGRRHVRCPDTAPAKIEPSFPNFEGRFDLPGWGVVDEVWRDPSTHFDIMSYCAPAWISGWGWNQLEPVIEAITTWSTQDQEAPRGEALVGMRGPDGTVERWTRVQGYTNSPPTEGDELSQTVRAEIILGNGRRAVVAAHVRPVTESQYTAVVVPLPAETPPTLTLVLREEGLAHRSYSVDEAG